MNNDRVLVLGDAMVDVHIFGQSERLSPEAPIPIIDVKKEEQSLGGAANVAAHIASAQIKNIFCYKSNSGTNKLFQYSDFATICSMKGITPEPLIFNNKIPLTTKKRIWSGKQQICRIDEENVDKPSYSTIINWYKQFVGITEKQNIKIVVLSDYDKGTFTDEFINLIASYCIECNIKVILDPKRPSFYKLKNLFAVKPNSKELNSTNLTPEQCSRELGQTYLIHTMGKNGMAVYKDGQHIFECPTVAKEVYDVTGAGDSVTALLGIALFYDLDIKRAVMAANRAASYTLQHLGCYCLTKNEIDECLSNMGD